MFLFCLLNAEHPRVVSVFLNQKKELHTPRSWEFLGLERNGKILVDSIWAKADLHLLVEANLEVPETALVLCKF